MVLVQGAMVDAKMGERNERELPRYGSRVEDGSTKRLFSKAQRPASSVGPRSPC